MVDIRGPCQLHVLGLLSMVLTLAFKVRGRELYLPPEIILFCSSPPCPSEKPQGHRNPRLPRLFLLLCAKTQPARCCGHVVQSQHQGHALSPRTPHLRRNPAPPHPQALPVSSRAVPVSGLGAKRQLLRESWTWRVGDAALGRTAKAFLKATATKSARENILVSSVCLLPRTSSSSQSIFTTP